MTGVSMVHSKRIVRQNYGQSIDRPHNKHPKSALWVRIQKLLAGKYWWVKELVRIPRQWVSIIFFAVPRKCWSMMLIIGPFELNYILFVRSVTLNYIYDVRLCAMSFNYSRREGGNIENLFSIQNRTTAEKYLLVIFFDLLTARALKR